MPFFKRKAELTFDPEQIKNIDYILISHGHYDHFDKKSLKLILKNCPDAKALLPMGMGRIYQKEIKSGFLSEGGGIKKKV